MRSHSPPRRVRLLSLLSYGLAVGAVVYLLGAAPQRFAASEDPDALPHDAVGGWRVFTEKQCIRCHSVWGVGGQIGSDLGRTAQEYLTASALAGALWNHIPRMQSYMSQNRVEYPLVSIDEMREIFGFLFFVRQLEEPGDPARGERLLTDKGCARCHFSGERPGVAQGLELRRWGPHANPVIWAQKIWQHAPKMEQAMKDADIVWPQLDDRDLVDIVAYVRSLGTDEATVYLRPGSPREGSRLFSERRCRSCHVRGGPAEDLSAADLPVTVTGLASRILNHLPAMTRLMDARGEKRIDLTPQELADVIAYLLVLRYWEQAGDAQRGRVTFERHRCTSCHQEEENASSKAPAIRDLAGSTSPVRFAHALWNHGGAMLEVLSEQGATWPVLKPGEVSDLISYLKSVAGTGRPVGARPAVSPPVAIHAEPAPHGPPIRPGDSCVSSVCHPRVVAGAQVHAPVGQGQCDACHVLQKAETHDFRLVADTGALCSQCHDESPEVRQPHGPVSVTVCTACHDPHSSENAYGPGFSGDEMCYANMVGLTSALAGLAGVNGAGEAYGPGAELTWGLGPRGAGDAPGVGVQEISPKPGEIARDATDTQLPPAGGAIEGGCVSGECHAALLAGPEIHLPVAQHQCEACHAAKDNQGHSFDLVAKESALCYQCHDPKEKTGEFVHGPLGIGLCTPCHEPHSAAHKPLLSAPVPDLCESCHSQTSEHLRSSRVQHSGPTEGKRSCLSCHDPHRSGYKFQLRKAMPELCKDCHAETDGLEEKFSVPHGPVNDAKSCSNCHDPHGSEFESILVDSEMNLCLGCHDRPMDTPSGPIIDMKSWIEANPDRHGPIRQGMCTACHLPHGSDNFRLLTESFPKEFYQPYTRDTYALCFDCHEETLVLEARTTSLTGFRNGDKNLHYIHVNQEKGRTCRACHEIHAGTKPKRIKDYVPFGQWKYPVNFVETEDGGRCAPGCHPPRAYSRTQEIAQE